MLLMYDFYLYLYIPISCNFFFPKYKILIEMLFFSGFLFSVLFKYLNCVISYEVLILVRNSFNATQCDPPSLWKVTMQSVLVYVFGILVFTIHYFIGHAQLLSFEKGHFERSIFLNNLNFYWSLVVTYIFPVLFFSYVWITVWYRGYMPSATGRMKQLVRPFDSVMQLCIDRDAR